NGDFAAWLDLDGRALPPAGGRRRRRAEGADLAIGGHADAHEPAGGLCLGLLLPESGVIDGIERLLERRRIVAAVIAQAGGGGVRKLVGGGEVLEAQLSRVHFELG